METQSGDRAWESMYAKDKNHPAIHLLERHGFNDDASSVLTRAYEWAASYKGEGQWFVTRSPNGEVAILLLGHPDGQRRFVLAETHLYGECGPHSATEEGEDGNAKR